MPPGGTAIYTGISLPWQGDVLIGVLGFGADVGHLHRISLDGAGNVTRSETYLRADEGYGRLRDVVMGPGTYPPSDTVTGIVPLLHDARLGKQTGFCSARFPPYASCE